jgi:hypothetical protein
MDRPLGESRTTRRDDPREELRVGSIGDFALRIVHRVVLR